MPKATVDTSAVHFDLKTLPGGWVELRRMSFGEKNARTDIAMKMAFEGVGSKSKSKDTKATMAASTEAASQHDFRACVVDHNLFADDDETIKLNLSRPEDLKQLDPRVGEEIATLISNMNNFEPEELDDLKNEFSS